MVWVLPFYLGAQEYRMPLDLPPALSGTFAELRSHHFHSGLDFKTQGREGHPVYAVEKGHISRIRVSATGFGNALYVQHPDGKTSVYAHLQRFNDTLHSYLRSRQYALRQSEVDLFPEAGALPVDRGTILGLSGNSGSSGGPHLHFELRDTRSEHPLNPQRHGFACPDQRKPELRGLAVVGLDARYRETSRRERFSFGKPADTLWVLRNLVPGGYGLEVDAIDRLDLSDNANGVFRAWLSVDGTERYRFEASEFSFDETRQIDALVNYERKVAQGKVWHRLYRLPGNALSLCQTDDRRGRIWLAPGDSVRALLWLEDASGNTTRQALRLCAAQSSAPSIDTLDAVLWNRNRDPRFTFGQHRAWLPAEALYRDEVASVDTNRTAQGLYGKAIRILHPGIPFRSPLQLEFDLGAVPYRIRSKTVAVRIADNGRFSSLGGSAEGGRWKANSREGGTFGLAVDTIAPKVEWLKPRAKGAVSQAASLRFSISDGLSGIGQWVLTLDGAWAVLEFDAKTGLLWHRFESKPEGRDRNYRLEVTDKSGNKTVREGVVRW